MSNTVDVLKLPATHITDAVTGQGYFPVICGLGGAACVVVLRGGAGHLGLDCRLDTVRSLDAGRTWETPVTVADSERDDRNPALGRAADGTLVLAYHWQCSYGADGKWDPQSRHTDTRVVYSRDDGQSWGDDHLLDYAPLNGASPFGKIRRARDGVLYMPIYGGGKILTDIEPHFRVGPATTPTYILRSRDSGKTWGEPIFVALGLNEADLLILDNGDWLFAARSEERSEQAIFTCRSGDEGKSWGDLTRVTEPSEHPPDLTLLAGGQVLLTFGRRHAPFGVEGIISPDGGRTWASRRLALATDLPGTDIGYPSTLRFDNGSLLTVYYAAGTAETPNDGYIARNAYCRAVGYDETELLQALA